MENLWVLISEITKDRIDLGNDGNGDSDEIDERFIARTGTFSVKMRLLSDMPQLFFQFVGKKLIVLL
jgi:hypothetical protein